MTWSLSRMARYVAQSKYLERLKQNDDACLQAFDKGSFLMFFDGKPLLNKMAVGGGLGIAWAALQGIIVIKDSYLTIQRNSLYIKKNYFLYRYETILSKYPDVICITW